MVYKNLKFPYLKSRAYFFSNFVSTLDGKAQVKKAGYDPIGSEIDWETFIDLRRYADILIHGKNTAIPHPTLTTLANYKISSIAYAVISNHPDDRLVSSFKNNPAHIKSILFTSEKAHVSKKLSEVTEVVRVGKKEVDLQLFSSYLFKNGYKKVLLEGGPTLMGSFVKEGLLDELFLTITPKIFGNSPGQTLSMVEGHLLPPNQVKHLKLLSVKPVKNELYLRYKVIHK